MVREFQNAGARRLLIAAGVSLALHAAVAVSIHRAPGGNNPLSRSPAAAPLIARLTTAVTESVLPIQPIADESPPANTASHAPVSFPGPATPPLTAGSATASGAVYYFKASELDRRPFPLTRIEVPPPESAEAAAGSVMIRLRISESGRVEDAKIIMGTGISEFETAALREFSRARFHPGYRGNLPVRSEMLIEVTLRPPASGSTERPATTAQSGN